MNTFNLGVLAAERAFYEGECQSLIVPITDGLLGIQANHNNMVSAVIPGNITITTSEGNKIEAHVSQGILIVADNEVRILVDEVETEDEKELNRIKREKEDEREAKLQKKSVQEFKSAQLWLARENSMLKRNRSRRYNDR